MGVVAVWAARRALSRLGRWGRSDDRGGRGPSAGWGAASPPVLLVRRSSQRGRVAAAAPAGFTEKHGGVVLLDGGLGGLGLLPSVLLALGGLGQPECARVVGGDEHRHRRAVAAAAAAGGGGGGEGQEGARAEAGGGGGGAVVGAREGGGGDRVVWRGVRSLGGGGWFPAGGRGGGGAGGEGEGGAGGGGSMVVDRYNADQAVDKVMSGLIVLAFCWGHVRRDFLAAARSWPDQEAWRWVGLDGSEGRFESFFLVEGGAGGGGVGSGGWGRGARGMAVVGGGGGVGVGGTDLHRARREILESLREGWGGRWGLSARRGGGVGKQRGERWGARAGGRSQELLWQWVGVERPTGGDDVLRDSGGLAGGAGPRGLVGGLDGGAWAGGGAGAIADGALPGLGSLRAGQGRGWVGEGEPPGWVGERGCGWAWFDRSESGAPPGRGAGWGGARRPGKAG